MKKKKKKDFIQYLKEIKISESIIGHAAFEQLFSIQDALELFLLPNTEVVVVPDQNILQILNREKNTLINIINTSVNSIVIEYTSFLKEVLYCEDIHLVNGRLVNLREYRRDETSIFIEQHRYDNSGLELEVKLMVKDMTKEDSKILILSSLKRCVNGYVAACHAVSRDASYYKIAELNGYVDLDLSTPYLRVDSNKIVNFDNLKHLVGTKATYRSPSRISDLEFDLYSRDTWPNGALSQFLDKISSTSMNRPNDACFRKEFSIKDLSNKNIY